MGGGRSGPAGGRGRALAPRSSGTPSGTDIAAWVVQLPLLRPAAFCSLPPEKELTVLGATHKAPCTPSGPSCPGGRSPCSFSPHQPRVLSSQPLQTETGSRPLFPDRLCRSLSSKQRCRLSLMLTRGALGGIAYLRAVIHQL